MNITRRYEIDAGHRVPGHEGKCRFLHGHRYAVEATMEGPVADDDQAPDAGMVVDFGALKRVMGDVLDLYDHRMMLWDQDPLGRLLDAEPIANEWGVVLVPVIPTAERLAELWAAEMGDTLAFLPGGGQIVGVRVWETPNCSALWTP